jgi:hypothetical protein
MQQTVEACAVGMVRIAPSCHSHCETCQSAESGGPEIQAVRTLDMCPCRVDASHRRDGLTGNMRLDPAEVAQAVLGWLAVACSQVLTTLRSALAG